MPIARGLLLGFTVGCLPDFELVRSIDCEFGLLQESLMVALESEAQEIPVSRVDSAAWIYRLIGWLLGVLPIGLLVVAGQLQPSSAGLGTHQQLGLPPCTMLVVFGVRCPSCGMTTSWAYFARGQLMESAAVNLGGFLLAIYSLIFAFFCVMFAIQGRVPSDAAQKWLAVSLLAIVAVTLVGWGFRLLA